MTRKEKKNSNRSLCIDALSKIINNDQFRLDKVDTLSGQFFLVFLEYNECLEQNASFDAVESSVMIKAQ